MKAKLKPSLHDQLSGPDRAELLLYCARLLLSRKRAGLKPRMRRTIMMSGWHDCVTMRQIGLPVYFYIDRKDIAVVVDANTGQLLVQSLPFEYWIIDPLAKIGGAP